MLKASWPEIYLAATKKICRRVAQEMFMWPKDASTKITPSMTVMYAIVKKWGRSLGIDHELDPEAYRLFENNRNQTLIFSLIKSEYESLDMNSTLANQSINGDTSIH